MPIRVYFTCPSCDYPARQSLSAPVLWQCPRCDQRLALTCQPGQEPADCSVCGNVEMYKKKDFPHTLGMAILIVACLVSFITFGWYELWLTWAILLGTAVFDGVLYLLVGDAAVCYRCHAHYRGLRRSSHPPFDLGIGERYRQERLRHQQLAAEAQTRKII